VALYKAEAVVLRAAAFGEADRLLSLLSPEHGKIRAVARGTSRPRSRLAAGVQPFVRGRYVLWRGRELDGVSQAEIVEPHRGLGRDLGAMVAASYCCELTDALCPERQEARQAFATLLDALSLLSAGEGERALVLRWFELRALSDAGFAPQLDRCAACGGALPAAGRQAFSPAAGGLLCASCPAEGGAPWVGASTGRALRYLARASAADLRRTTAAPGTHGELRRVLAAHAAHTLQRPLRSQALLDSI
jgi:DNA repair protein RecO (recombination protein O)